MERCEESESGTDVEIEYYCHYNESHTLFQSCSHMWIALKGYTEVHHDMHFTLPQKRTTPKTEAHHTLTANTRHPWHQASNANGSHLAPLDGEQYIEISGRAHPCIV